MDSSTCRSSSTNSSEPGFADIEPHQISEKRAGEPLNIYVAACRESTCRVAKERRIVVLSLRERVHITRSVMSTVALTCRLGSRMIQSIQSDGSHFHAARQAIS